MITTKNITAQGFFSWKFGSKLIRLMKGIIIFLFVGVGKCKI